MRNKKFVLGFLLMSCVLFSSCIKEGCTDNEAENFDSKAKEDDGTCTYEADKFVGGYAMQDNLENTSMSMSWTENYTLTITRGSGNSLVIENVGNYGKTFDAQVSGDSFSFNDSYFSGTGSLSGTTLTLDYTYNEVDNITGSGTGEKQ